MLAVAVAVIAFDGFAFYLFQPHKLFIDDKVNEDLSYQSAPAVTPAQSPAPAPAGPVAVSAGDFVSVEHSTSGTAVLIRNPDGSYVLRLEDFRTDNGPDLFVSLSTNPAGSGRYAGLTNLSRLKGNVGSQNYDVPAGVDIEAVKSVVIWCQRFSVAFGEAPINRP